jgi:hypothetical protein
MAQVGKYMYKQILLILHILFMVSLSDVELSLGKLRAN